MKIEHRLHIITHLNKMIELAVQDDMKSFETYVIALHARFCECCKEKIP